MLTYNIRSNKGVKNNNVVNKENNVKKFNYYQLLERLLGEACNEVLNSFEVRRPTAI